jgi:hypothetical protein
MSLIQPILLSLDSSTLGNLARDRGSNREADRVTELLNSGIVLPFLSFHHLLELNQHANASIRDRRTRYLESLKLVAFHKTSDESPNVGDIIDLQSAEAMTLLQEPDLTLNGVVAKTQSKITSGVCSGHELVMTNREFWDLLRSLGFVEHLEEKAANVESLASAASLNPKARLPKPGEYRPRSKVDALKVFSVMLSRLTSELKDRGDRRIQDPQTIAMEFLRQVYREGAHIWESDSADPFLDAVLRNIPLDPSRLPRNATIEDLGYEAIFFTKLSVLDERLGLPERSAYSVIRQEMLPTWRIWRGLDRVMDGPKAAGSNMSDRYLACYTPYVGWLQTDKRVEEFFRQAGRNDQFLKPLVPKIFRCGPLSSLRSKLEAICLA